MPVTPAFEYHILEVLGRGGMGTVYRAEMHGLDTSGGFTKIVAVKILNPEVQGNPDLVQRLRDEARMLGLVRHRAIVQVDRLLVLDDRWAIVMEYVGGFDVAELLLRYGPMPLGPALEVVSEVASALHVAYNAPPEGGADQMQPLRLVHRDLKPANIRVTPSGGVKLLDFGVAQAQFPGREAQTDSLRYGSTRYMSPQRLCWEDDGHFGDLYALGAVLYELLIGRQLGLASDQPAAHRQIVRAACDNLEKKGVPEPVISLVRECLSFHAQDRPDARAFLQRARRAADGELSLQEWTESLPLHETPLRGGASGAELPGLVLREPVSGGAAENHTLDWPVLAPLPRGVVQDSSLDVLDPRPVPGPRIGRRRPYGWIAVAFGVALLAVVFGLSSSEEPASVVPEPAPRPVVPCAVDVADAGRAQVAGVDTLFRGWQQLDIGLLEQALSPDFARREHLSGKAQDRAAYLAERAAMFERAQSVVWTGPHRDEAGFGTPEVEGDLAVRCRADGHLRVVVRYDWTVTMKSGRVKDERAVVDAYELDADGRIVQNIDYAELNMALSWRDACCL
jgi:serine/threonine protein kinase